MRASLRSRGSRQMRSEPSGLSVTTIPFTHRVGLVTRRITPSSSILFSSAVTLGSTEKARRLAGRTTGCTSGRVWMVTRPSIFPRPLKTGAKRANLSGRPSGVRTEPGWYQLMLSTDVAFKRPNFWLDFHPRIGVTCPEMTKNFRDLLVPATVVEMWHVPSDLMEWPP